MTTSTHLTAGDLRVEIGSEGLRITNIARDQILIDSKGAWPLMPIIADEATEARFSEVRATDEGFDIEYEVSEASVLASFKLSIKTGADLIDISSEFTARRACQMTALSVLPAGSALNVYDVVNFRNRHFTPATWPELLVGPGMATTTYSNDWQFAPHPTALLLRKSELTVFLGFADLQPGFGLSLHAKQFAVERCEVDYGAAPHGLNLASGQVFRSARLRVFAREEKTPHEMFKEFGRTLIRDGSIPDPARKVRQEWWREPLYCTWGDQWMIGEHMVAESLADQTAESASPAASLLTEELIWKSVEVIQRLHLPIRTIILDEGWAVARGDWRPDPRRLPDLRRVVDRLHAQGFKVMVWWNWAEVSNDADVDVRYLAADGWRNKHGCRWRDYSDPVVQDEYLKPLFRTLFSSEEGCLDLDGVKTDFLADKVHAETPLHDPSWRGEEIYFLRTTELFYREMRKHKADACHLGCAGHYWLAEFTDLNRTYDVHSSDWREHEERGRMLACTSPGVPVSYDMMTCTENTDLWFRSAARLGASIEIGNLLQVRDSCLTGTRPADEAYYAMLQRGFEDLAGSAS